jgi:ketosteroid isomerase-like protein
MADEKQRYLVCYDYGTGGLVGVLPARPENKIACACPDPGHRLSPTGNQEGQAMAEHPNVARIKNVYAAFAKGDLAALNDVFAEDLVWHDCGRNQLSGDYRGREAVFQYFGKVMEVTEGSLHLDLHSVLADDEHGVALMTISASRGGRSFNGNAVDVMHLRDGKVVEVWAIPTDQYTYDEVIG